MMRYVRRLFSWTLVGAAFLAAGTFVFWLASGRFDAASPKVSLDEMRWASTQEADGRTVIAASADIAPRAHYLGDRLEAHVTVFFDETMVVPSSVRVKLSQSTFVPYLIVAGPTEVRQRVGSMTVVRTSLALQCIEASCLPTESGDTHAFWGALVQYSLRRDATKASALYFSFPRVKMPLRIVAADISPVVFRSSGSQIAETSYRIPPETVGWGLAGGAVALLIVSALMCRRALKKGATPERVSLENVPKSALETLEDAFANGVVDRTALQPALDALGEDLLRAGRDDLALRAWRFAWSGASFDTDALRDLLHASRDAMGGGSRG